MKSFYIRFQNRKEVLKKCFDKIVKNSICQNFEEVVEKDLKLDQILNFCLKNASLKFKNFYNALLRYQNFSEILKKYFVTFVKKKKQKI